MYKKILQTLKIRYMMVAEVDRVVIMNDGTGVYSIDNAIVCADSRFTVEEVYLTIDYAGDILVYTKQDNIIDMRFVVWKDSNTQHEMLFDLGRFLSKLEEEHVSHSGRIQSNNTITRMETK